MSALQASFVAQVRDSASLTSLVEQAGVRLVRRGHLRIACCPFHAEKTPSFTVYPDQHFHCFGCGAHGDGIRFVMQFDGVAFRDAVLRIASEAGIPVPENQQSETPAERRQREERITRQRVERQRAREAEIAAELDAETDKARTLIAQTIPWHGTPAEQYWRTTRSIPEAAHDRSGVLRYHPRRRALIAIATDWFGTTVAGQMILLRRDGSARTGSDGKTIKLTIGRPAATTAIVRLPGDSDGPLLVGEGVENVDSVASVTGFEGWASLGSITRIEPPAHRLIIALSDGDKPGSAAARGLEAWVEKWREHGRSVVIARPLPSWPGKKVDWNDRLREGSAAEVLLATTFIIRRNVTPPESADPPPSCNAPVLSAGGYFSPYKTNLPSYYAPVTELQCEALARQANIITGFITRASYAAGARYEVRQRRAQALLAMPAATPADKMRLTRRLIREVAERHNFPDGKLPRPERLLLTGSQGTGKTTNALKATARIDENVIVHKLAPTLAKATEDLADYRRYATERSMPAMVIRGRGATDPAHSDGRAMCPRYVIANRAARLGVSPRATICPSCRLNEVCGSMRQERTIEAIGDRALFIMSREYLTLPTPAPAADIIIADERQTIEAVASADVAPSQLSPDILPNDAPQSCTTTMIVLREALQSDASLARARDIGHDAIIALRKAVTTENDTQINGQMSDAEIDRELDSVDHQSRRSVLALITAVARELDMPRDTFNAVRWNARSQHVEVDWLRRPRVGRAALLLLDGTGDINLNRGLFGANIAHEIVRFERDAQITGTIGKRYSRQSITGCDRQGSPLPHRKDDARRLRDEIGTIAARHPHALLVTTKRAQESCVDGGHLPAGIETEHFENLRGRNPWESKPAAIVVGQESLAIHELERLARAFYANDPVPLVSMARVDDLPHDWPIKPWPYRATRLRRISDGRLQAVEVDVHPDPRVQRVLEQVREAEVLQAVDRVRPVFNHRTLVLANELVLDLTYDRVLRHSQLVAGGSRIERAFLRTGVLPLTPEDVVRCYPDLWRSEATARADLRAFGEKGGTTPKGDSIWDCTPFSYRRPGQRGRLARVLIDTTRGDPKTLAYQVLGKLAAFAPVDPQEPQHALAPLSIDTPDAIHVGSLRPASAPWDGTAICVQPWMIDQLDDKQVHPPDG
jgi:phage/plasmid primase-like uncharacterized protein